MSVLVNWLAKLFLSKEARELGAEFKQAGICGAEVIGRGTLVVDDREIVKSLRRKSLQK